MTEATIPLRGAVHRLASWVKRHNGWRAAALCCGAGLVSALAFAPIFLWPILFATFPILIWRIDVATTDRAAAVAGWWFAFGYFFASLFWIGEAFLVEAELFAWLLPFAVTLLPAGLACFWAVAIVAARRLHWRGPARVVSFALMISLAEYARGHMFTGLPWNLVGYALTGHDALMQATSVVGVYGLTALALVLFPLPLVLAAASAMTAKRVVAVISLVVVALVSLAGFGAFRLASIPADSAVDGVRLRIVQPSVPQREKWMAEHQRRIFDDHLALSRTRSSGASDRLEGITHVIWPEAAMPFLPLEHPEALEAIARLLPDGVTLVTGALRRQTTTASADEGVLPEAKLFNGVLVFDDAGQVAARYDKLHLVPFGEYLPFNALLTGLGLKKLTHGRGAFSAGPVPRPLLEVPGLPKAIALVCYEALFSGAVVQGTERPAVILNVTNDGWFGQTSGPHQHFHQARVRAVEEGLPLIRAANNGISAIIDATGRVRDVLGLDLRGVIDGPLPPALPATLFARIGDTAFVFFLCIFGLVIRLARRPLGG